MKTRYIVQCNRHGQESKDWAGKQVVVQRQHSKTQRKDGGCPHCNAEARDAEPTQLRGAGTP